MHFRILPAMAFAIAVSACGGDEAITSGDKYAMQPGKWEIRTWMEVNGEAGPNPEELVQPRELSPEMARYPVNELLFGLFYPGQSAEHITANNGRIGGYFEQAGTGPIPSHTSDVSGTYDDDEFRMVIDLPVMASGMTQVVEGRLVEPLK